LEGPFVYTYVVETRLSPASYAAGCRTTLGDRTVW